MANLTNATIIHGCSTAPLYTPQVASQVFSCTRPDARRWDGMAEECRAYHDHARFSVSLVASRMLPASLVSTLALAVQVAPSSNLESMYSTSSSLESGVKVALTSLPSSSSRE